MAADLRGAELACSSDEPIRRAAGTHLQPTDGVAA